jgi:hypothetical protein
MPHQEYVVDGKPWPSATELTSLLPQVWLWSWYKNSVRAYGWRGWQKNLATSNRGMRIGTEVHSLIEGFIHNIPLTVSGKYDSQSYADALFDYVNPKVFEYVEIEPHLQSQELKIHGTADLICRMEGEPGLWVGDWKTSAQKSDTHPIQLAIYALCWNEANPGLMIDQGWIARVDKKSKKLGVKIDEYRGLKKYYPIIRALRTIWDYSKGLGEFNNESSYSL